VPVSLVVPAMSRHKRVLVGASVIFKCKADRRTDITWYFNDSTRLHDSRGVYVLAAGGVASDAGGGASDAGGGASGAGGGASGTGGVAAAAGGGAVGVATSELHLQAVRRRQSGRYSCRSAQDASDADSILLTVSRHRPADTTGTIDIPHTL